MENLEKPWEQTIPAVPSWTGSRQKLDQLLKESHKIVASLLIGKEVIWMFVGGFIFLSIRALLIKASSANVFPSPCCPGQMEEGHPTGGNHKHARRKYLQSEYMRSHKFTEGKDKKLCVGLLDID